jgi:hypothetical protein
MWQQRKAFKEKERESAEVTEEEGRLQGKGNRKNEAKEYRRSPLEEARPSLLGWF